jgi:hypothetical protein
MADKKVKSVLPKPTKGKNKRRNQVLASARPRVMDFKITPIHKFVSQWRSCAVGREMKCRPTDGVKLNSMLIEPMDVSAASPFIDLNTVYRFRLGGYATLSTSTGVINTFFACDPSASGVNFGEWSTLSALFSEFRMVSFQVSFTTFLPIGFSASQLGAVGIAANLGTATNPGSYAALADNADCKLWQALKDVSKTGYTHTLYGKGLNWSQVTTPTVEPYAGAPGSIQVYHNSGSASFTDIIQCLVSGIYEFRSRV